MPTSCDCCFVIDKETKKLLRRGRCAFYEQPEYDDETEEYFCGNYIVKPSMLISEHYWHSLTQTFELTPP